MLIKDFLGRERKTIYQKLIVNKPQLKEGLSEIKGDKKYSNKELSSNYA